MTIENDDAGGVFVRESGDGRKLCDDINFNNNKTLLKRSSKWMLAPAEKTVSHCSAGKWRKGCPPISAKSMLRSTEKAGPFENLTSSTM
jgi:hypothetical protein